jgi:glycosyltransferase involved in cell wall biosynthesis
MSSPPLVSIVTPTYNHERYIASCIQSVIDQVYENWEMLVVDDGSTDRTVEIVKSFSDKRIRLITQENKGLMRLGETYNAALAQAQGDVVAILEGDDFWPSGKLAMQVRHFRDPEVVLSSGITRIEDDDGEWLGLVPTKPLPSQAVKNDPVGFSSLYMMDPHRLTFTFPVSTAIRADALRRIGGFLQPDYLPVVDFPTFLRLGVEGKWQYEKEIFGVWRRHGGSQTKSHFPVILEAVYRCSMEFIHEHRDRLPASDEELDDLQDYWQYFMVQLCVLRGRVFVAHRRWSDARKAFEQAKLFKRTWKTDFAAKMSRSLAGLKLPCEWLYVMAGRGHWRQLFIQDTGDPWVSLEDLERERYVGVWRKPERAD